MSRFDNREGQRVPEVVFRARTADGWNNLTTQDLFAGKTVAVFSLPGAFTPTCSSAHVPRYEELAPALKAAGVDDILCVSVNDGFVMHAWGVDQGVDAVQMIPDGNGEFTRGMGMLVDKDALGFGARSWRYSMVVKDGVVAKMFIEPDVDGDPYGVSDADTMLNYLQPDAEAPADVVLFTRPGCSHCARAKAALTEAGLGFSAVDVDRRALRAVAGDEHTPQVFINSAHIGGREQLEAWLAARG
jgi:peroxiredoxin/glutaredoxin